MTHFFRCHEGIVYSMKMCHLLILSSLNTQNVKFAENNVKTSESMLKLSERD